MQSKAKPATKAEKERFKAIGEIGCIPCWIENMQYREPDVQHVVEGGKRKGHEYTYGCCPWHHRGVLPDGMTGHQAERDLGPSLAVSRKDYHARYGGEDHLVALQNVAIDLTKEGRFYSWMRKFRGRNEHYSS